MKIDFLFFKDGLGGPLVPDFLQGLKGLSGANTFIETGTYMGNTVDSVRTLFEHVVSVELSDELYRKASARFAGVPNVKILHGESERRLKDALKLPNIGNSIVWLDAHYSGEGTSKSTDNTPILNELDVIAVSGRDMDVIMIDDIRMFGSVADGFLKHEAILGYPDIKLVVDKISNFGKGYDCFLLADILLAIPKSLRSAYKVSPTLAAITELKFSNLTSEERGKMEVEMIERATAEEKKVILALPEIFSQQLEYGLGGDFCYWRYLLHKHEGRKAAAGEDYQLWRRCEA